MKKIVILTLHLYYGGIEKYISDLCNILNNDYEIEIICTYGGYNPVFKIPNNVKITYLLNCMSNRQAVKDYCRQKDFLNLLKECFHSISILYNKWKLNKRAIKGLNADFVITTRMFHNYLVNKYCPKGIIKIGTDHNYHENSKKYINLLKKTTSSFNYFVCITQELYCDYKKVLKPKCIYIPNMICRTRNKSLLCSNAIISVGRFDKNKAFNDVIKISNLLRSNKVDFIWHLVGDGPEYKMIKKNIKMYHLENNVILHGYLNTNDISLLYDKTSLYVMTSISESFGIVLLEAMSHGVPCIAFDSAHGAKEILKDCGLLISNRNLCEMANIIKYYLYNKNKLKIISEKCEKICDNYYYDVVKKKWIELLEVAHD